MRSFILLIILSLFLYCVPAASCLLAQEEESEDTQTEIDLAEETNKPMTEGSLKVKWFGRELNLEARSNPENEILDLKQNRQTVEATASVSDYLDDDQAWRWLFKVYGYQLYEREATSDVNNNRIDELFVDWAGDDWFISLGKRRNSWGPALAFNPVNVVVPPRDPLSPDQQTEGQPMLFISFASDLIALDLIATRNYDRDWYGQYSRWGARLAVILDEMDFGFYYFDGEEDENEKPYSRMVGFSFSSNFLTDSTLYLEAASFSENERNYYDDNGVVFQKDETVTKAVLGSNTTIDGNTSLLIEIFHNSAGYSEEERKNYFKAVDSVIKPFFDITKVGIFSDHQFGEMNNNYLLISFRKTDILDQMGFTFQILGAEDGSSVTKFEGDYNISDYYKFTLTLSHYNGDENSEFGNSTIKSEIELGLSAAF